MDLLEGDDKLLIEAATAFIESLESNELSEMEVQGRVGPEADTGEDSNRSVSDSSTPRKLTKRSSAGKARRKRKNKPGYSAEQGRRKKTEVLALRHEVLGLEKWFTRLQQRESDPMPLSSFGTANPSHEQHRETKHLAKKNVMKEFQKREQSLDVNFELKSILDNQIKVNRSVCAVLRQAPVLSETDLQVLSPPTEPKALLRIDNTPAIVDQLADRVARLYLDCDSDFPKENTSSMPSFGCSLQPTVDKYRGRAMEIVARAPADCSMEQASDILWKELSTVRIYPDKVYRYMTERGPDAVAKGFVLTLRSRQETTAINGLQFMKKFEEKDRIVQVRAYKLLLFTEGVHLRGHAWTIISKSASDPLQSDVKFYLQLFVETQSGFSALDTDMNYIQYVGLKTWSLMMRTYSIWLQELVVEKA